MRTTLVAALAVLSGCPQTQSEFVEPPPTPFDIALFPTVAGNAKLFADVGEARLEFDPTTTDAISALGSCVDATVYCYQPGTKELAWCLEHTRTCATQTPWSEKPCCPQQCKDEFVAAVDAGVPPSSALEQVFFTKKDCFPGLKAALEGTP